MSHQSGIQVSTALASKFAQVVSGSDTRAVKIIIENESLVEAACLPANGTFEQDWTVIQSLLEDKVPCYIAFRLDNKTAVGYDWAFICYVPDLAKVRDKMLYASTRSTLRKSLGDNHFVDDMYATDKRDLTWEGYQKHRTSVSSSAPLTQREEEIARMRKEESGADVGITTKKAHVHGVFFPMTDDAKAALQKFANNSVNYVQLSINSSGELIELVSSSTLSPQDISGQTPSNQPRYHFFRYHHSFEDNTLDSVVFIYSCPMASPVKERMLYSSCKSAVIAIGQEEIGLTIDKNSEISDAVELTENFIFEELHPKKADDKKTFKKPMRPGRIRSTDSNRTSSNDE